MNEQTIGIKVNARAGKKAEQYPLTIDQLRPGQFAECDNGTIVFAVDSTDQSRPTALHTTSVYNLYNGIGYYRQASSRFRLLDMKTLTINTDAYGGIVSQ
jgi:hypothetical protein